MGRFVLTVMGVALIGGVMGMLSPDGETKKYVRLVASLCLLCALASPLVRLISEGGGGIDDIFPSVSGEVDSYEEIYGEALAQGARENAEAAVKLKLISRFGLAEKSLDITLTLSREGNEYVVESAQVVLNSSAVFADPREISEFINGELGCPCTVLYG